MKSKTINRFIFSKHILLSKNIFSII